MVVIELAAPGQEATTYELIISIVNACITLNGILGTQVAAIIHANSCEDTCTGDSNEGVDTTSIPTFVASDGPYKYTKYTIVITILSLIGIILFTPFLPTQKAQCQEWKEKGQQAGNSVFRGIITAIIAFTVVAYSIVVSILLIFPSTSCMSWIGGEGC